MFKINNWGNWNRIVTGLRILRHLLNLEVITSFLALRINKYILLLLAKFTWFEMLHWVKITHFFRSRFAYVSQSLNFLTPAMGWPIWTLVDIWVWLPSWNLLTRRVILISFLIENFFHLFQFRLDVFSLFLLNNILHVLRRNFSFGERV